MTFPVKQSFWPVVSRKWSLFRGRVNKLYRGCGFPGIRVAEWHPGGHGWHVHFLTSVYRRVEGVREQAQAVGFGRVNVIYLGKREQDMARYLAKHFSKDFGVNGARHKGQRKWSCLGGFVGVRVKDIEVSSTFKDWLHGRMAVLGVRKLSAKQYRLWRREWLVGPPLVAWEQKEGVKSPRYVSPEQRPF